MPPTLPRLIVLALLLTAFQAAAAGFPGEVVAVLDGDTIEVLHDKRPVRVRLASIDAPEKSQPFGQRSRQALAALVFRKRVEVHDQGTERHGRTLGVVIVDGTNVNAEQVRHGYAWVYRAYSNNPTLLALESEARAEGRGLWADVNPVPPWDFRRLKVRR